MSASRLTNRRLSAIVAPLSWAAILIVAGSCTNDPDGVDLASTTPTIAVDTPTTTPVTIAEAPSGPSTFPLSRRHAPPFDPVEWAIGNGADIDVIADEPLPLAEVGDSVTFSYNGTLPAIEVEATMVYENQAVTMWFADDVDVVVDDVALAAERFANEVVPLVEELFGPIPSPGVDGDPRIAILHLNSLGEAAGEFSATDLLPSSVHAQSNGREMLYIVGDIEVGSDFHIGVLTHELTHLVDYSHRANRQLWLAEALGQLVEHRGGTDSVTSHGRYLAKQTVQLNSWGPLQLDDRSYGAGYLYLVYLWEQHGDEIIRAIIQSEYAGIGGIEDALAQRGINHSDFFAQWIGALIVDSRDPDEGGFSTLELPQVCGIDHVTDLPWSTEAQIPQFAPRYVTMTGEGLVEVSFEGSPAVGAIPDGPYEGEWMWWAGPADGSAARLTREFDLTGLSQATLAFAAWFDTGYLDTTSVMVSDDDGARWTIVSGPQAQLVFVEDVVFDGYSGWSGSGDGPEWINESIDLSAFVGSKVLVRFQFSSDLFEGRIGFALDDIELIELETLDGAEEDRSEWLAEGFQRVPESVPQPWIVEYVDVSGVTRVPVEDGSAQFDIDLGDGDPVIMAVAATAPGIGTPASYELSATGSASLVGVSDRETFDLPCGDWEFDQTMYYSITQEAGELVITTHEPDVFTWSARQGDPDVVSIEASMQFGDVDDGAGGLMCRLSQAGFYELNVATDGTYLIGVAMEEDYQTLVGWTSSELVNQGPQARNDLRLECGDGEIAASINGTEVERLTDDRLPPGRIAVIAASFDTADFSVAYDNIAVISDPLGRAAVIDFDTFDDPSTTWAENGDLDSVARVKDGELVLSVATADWSAEIYTRQQLENVSFSADFRIIDAASDGLVGATCNVTKAFDQYLFLLAFDGSYAVQAWIDGAFTDIVPWTYGSGLVIEPDTPNHMDVTCADGHLRWIVNGATLDDLDHDALQGGKIGFVAYTLEYGRLEMRLDNVTISSP